MNESQHEEQKIQIVSVREGEQPFQGVLMNLTQSKIEKVAAIKKDDPKSFKTIGEYTIDFGKLLGSGKYGKVYPAFHKTEYEEGKRYACKVIQLKASKASEQPNPNQTDADMLQKIKDEEENKYLKQQFSQEVEVMQMIHSKHVIKVIKAYKSQSRHYLITELCNSGDLSTLMDVRRHLTEEEARIILK